MFTSFTIFTGLPPLLPFGCTFTMFTIFTSSDQARNEVGHGMKTANHDGFTALEIAGRLGCTRQNVHACLNRA